MSDQDGVAANVRSKRSWFLHFGLIVTGRAEEQHLPKMFRSLMSSGACRFETIRFINQRPPLVLRRPEQAHEITGTDTPITPKDELEIALPTRRYLDRDDFRFVILVDDLEYRRREQAKQVFDRYRRALDAALRSGQQHRASVHFLVYMLEAYYFADADAINEALQLNPPLGDYPGDVETIRNPKGRLENLHGGFDEKEDGGRILTCIDMEHVLSRPNTCASLRTLFAWCVKALQCYSVHDLSFLSGKYQLADGILWEVTQEQLDDLHHNCASVTS